MSIIDHRSAAGSHERLPDMVSELIGLKIDLFVVRGTPEILAVQQATKTIPVVMTAVVDPVALGVAKSLSRPGGNITGMSSRSTELEAKRVQMLKEIVPRLKHMPFLGDLRNSAVQMQWEDARLVARNFAIDAHLFDVRTAADVARAFEGATQLQAEAIRVGVDGVTRTNKKLIIELAAKHKLPAIYAAREFVEDGGLISYSADYADLYLRAASFVVKIFKGAKPAICR